MFLLHCPRCRGVTPYADDAAEAACRWCGWRGTPPSENMRGSAADVRRHVLGELKPVAYLLFTFGIGQLLTAGVFVVIFILGNGAYLIGRFDHAPLLYAIGLVLLVGGILIVAAAVTVERGRNRLVAVTGAWLVITSPLLVGLPLGVWALRRLTASDVRLAFSLRG